MMVRMYRFKRCYDVDAEELSAQMNGRMAELGEVLHNSRVPA